MSLTARLEDISFAVACGHPVEARALGERLREPREHSVGTFSGWMGSLGGGARALVLAAGARGPAASRAATAQLAFLCPNARSLGHFGTAGATGRRFDPGEAIFIRETGFLNLPRAVHSIEQAPLLHPWLAGSAGWEAPSVEAESWLSERRETPERFRALARQQLFQEALLASASAPIDTPLQREWILEQSPPDDLSLDREGAGSAQAAAEAGKPWVAVKVVADSLATLRPGGLASWDRLERPVLRDALSRAAERFLDLLRAADDVLEMPQN